jgi:hypothetical protein
LIRYGVLLASVLGLAAESVTLDVGQYVNANKMRVLVFAGTISSRSVNEVVDVVGRDCGATGERLIAGTRTSATGSWRVEVPSQENGVWNYVEVFSGTAFRARWHGKFSEPRVWRVPAAPRVARIAGTRTWVVHVLPAVPSGFGLRGKTVELQRLSPGGWVRLSSARLVRKASLEWGAFNYQARFSVPTRGLKLRAYLPTGSAAPCYLPGASPTWRS